MTMIGKWKAEWVSKTQLFEKKTAKRGIWAAFLGCAKKKKRETQIAAAFGALDKAYAAMGKADGPAKIRAIEAFETALAVAKAAGEEHVSMMTRAAQREPEKRDLMRQVDILAKDIEACIATAEAMRVEIREMTRDDGSLDFRGAMTARTVIAKLAGAIKKAATWIAIQERTPDVAAFNRGVQTATRDMTVHLVQLEKAVPRGSPDQRILRAVLADLDGWAHRSDQLPDTARFDHVIVELGKIKGAVATLAKWLKRAKAAV